MTTANLPTGFAFSQASQSVAMFYNRNESIRTATREFKLCLEGWKHNGYCKIRKPDRLQSNSLPFPPFIRHTVGKQWLALACLFSKKLRQGSNLSSNGTNKAFTLRKELKTKKHVLEKKLIDRKMFICYSSRIFSSNVASCSYAKKR